MKTCKPLPTRKTGHLPSHACWRGSAVCDPPLYSHRCSSSDSRGAAPHRSASSCDHSARCATSLQRGRQWSCSVLPPERGGAQASRVECTSVLRVWLHTSGARGMRLASAQACLPAGVWSAIGSAPPTPPPTPSPHPPAVGQPPGGALGHLVAARVGTRAHVGVVGQAHGEAAAERVDGRGRGGRQHDAELDRLGLLRALAPPARPETVSRPQVSRPHSERQLPRRGSRGCTCMARGSRAARAWRRPRGPGLQP